MFILSSQRSSFASFFHTCDGELYFPQQYQNTLKTVNTHTLLADLLAKVSDSTL